MAAERSAPAAGAPAEPSPPLSPRPPPHWARPSRLWSSTITVSDTPLDFSVVPRQPEALSEGPKVHHTPSNIKQAWGAQGRLAAATPPVRKTLKAIWRTHEKHACALQGSVVDVALLLRTPLAERDASNQPSELIVVAEADVLHYDSPCCVMLVQLRALHDSMEPSVKAAAEQIADIEHLVENWGVLSPAHDGGKEGMMWPVHDPLVSLGVLTIEMDVLLHGLEIKGKQRWEKRFAQVLRMLRITTPPLDGPTLDTLQQQYGAGVEFVFAWSFFLTQQLWLLLAYAVVWILVGARHFWQGDLRWLWEVMKFGSIIWAFWVASQSRKRFGAPPEDRPRFAETRQGTFRPKETCCERLRRWAKLLAVAVPALSLLVITCCATFAGMSMLILHIIYIWGGCLHRHTAENPCRDAERFNPTGLAAIGWAAEVACDVLLAIIFEIFFPLGRIIAERISGLSNYEHESDRVLAQEMQGLWFAAMERIGFVGSLALLFVPQWQEPSIAANTISSMVDCGDLLFGESDYRCYQRRLDVHTRRWVFESLLKGPFMVAPFVSIILKTIVPRVAHKISACCGGSAAWHSAAPCRMLFRLVALIFTYDGEAVQCFRHVLRGRPFSEIPEAVPERKRLSRALQEVWLRPFEVEDELMELEMCFLWVTFFMPLLPIGVLFTLVARVVEINTDWTKLLFVRRRPFPRNDGVMRRETNTCAFCVALAGVGWTVGLSLITYNDEIWAWGLGGEAILVCMLAWLFLAPVAAFALSPCR